MVRERSTEKPGRSDNSDCWKDEGRKTIITSFFFIQKRYLDITTNCSCIADLHYNSE